MRRILFLCLMGLVCQAAMAHKDWNTQNVTIEGVEYATITAYKGSDTDIQVPKYIDGVKVYSITKLIDDTKGSTITTDQVTSLDFSKANYIKEIGANSCSNLTGLTTNIKLPKNLVNIGERAFESTNFNGPVDLSNKVKRLGDGAFGHTTGITRFVIPADIDFIGDNLLGQSNIPKIESKIIDPSRLENPFPDFTANVGDPNYNGYSWNPFLDVYNNPLGIPEKDKSYPELIVPEGTLVAYQNHSQWGSAYYGKSFKSITEVVSTSSFDKKSDCNIYVSNKQLNIKSDKQLKKVSVFNILGTTLKEVNSNSTNEVISINYDGIILVKVIFTNGDQKTFKVLSK
ncbi:leucine-rich repeat protein [Halosquirtibacter xylanolyticus]|uniref:leucine-rich repeat protein n=1 Tax=Halosquirtibacter xylanolyticus TaxID=3374599 RepID=UPI0037485BE1|nr:leucine-rich repeat protein [Prolixibacteraceae bacterium]